MVARAAAPRRARFAPHLLVLLLAGGCASLPEINAGECGNGVVEDKEDCDSFPQGTSACRPHGTAGECHFDCSRNASGVPSPCPTGWGCDPDGICHAPTGSYDDPREYKVGGVSSVLAGDFDGDHRQDVISLGPLDALGGTKMRLNYFDTAGALASSRLFPRRLATPVVADLSGDGLADVTFSSDLRVGVLLGQADRAWVPETYSSFHIPDAPVRFFAVFSDVVQDSSPAIALSGLGGKPGFYNVDPANGLLRFYGPLPGPLETLVGDPAIGNLLDDPMTSPCWELVLAVRAASAFTVANICRRDPTTQNILWRDEVEQFTVALDPPARIDQAPLIADLNDDGYLDVLLGADGKVYVSYGDGRKLLPATVLRQVTTDLIRDQPPMLADLPMPLAVADLNDDGAPDFVLGNRLLVSHRLPGSAAVVYRSSYENTGTPWTMARIADFNGNGSLDVVAASSGGLDLTFLNGTDSDRLPASSIATNGKVRFLAVGDFDGDLIKDVALVEAAVSARERDAVMIAFGSRAGTPSPPVVIARVSGPEDLSAFDERGLSTVVVASTETVNGHRNGLLILLDGNGDRLPLAPHLLTDLASGMVQDNPVLGLTAGSFTAAGQGDALALAYNPQADSLSFWLLPALGTSDRAALRFEAALDPRLHPLRITSGTASTATIDLAGASADLDGDGRDEALWAMPADTAGRCGLVVTGPVGPGSPKLARNDTVVIDQPCPRPQLVPADIDGDHWVDLVLLTGEPGQKDRKLMVLWNDGKGHLSATDVTVVSAPGDSPQGFTVVRGAEGQRVALAYITDQAATLLRPAGLPPGRGLAPPVRLTAIDSGTGIVAADVNGDGVIDLVLAASGNLRVMKASLAR